MDVKKPPFVFWIALPVLLTTLIAANILMGSSSISAMDIITAVIHRDPNDTHWLILKNIRLTKTATCILAGSGLSLGGLLMQTLFRNPLAGPGVLGISSGASLAVSLLLMGHLSISSSLPGPWVMALAASIGCAAVFIVILIFAQKVKDTVSLLIIGLMLGATTSSVVSVLQLTSRAEELQAYVIWTFGSVGGMDWSELHILWWLILAGLGIVLTQIKSLNAWLLGDYYAQSLGVNLKQSRLLIIFATSLITGGITAFCGPIAFVGLAVPHLIRMLIKTSNHRILIPQVVMGGACLLLLCDMLTQLPGHDKILPLNAVTALFGAPVVIWVVLQNKKFRI